MRIGLMLASILSFCCGVLPPPLPGLLLVVVIAIFFFWDHLTERRSLANGIILSLISGLVTISIGDIALRLFLQGSLYYRPDERLIQHSPLWEWAYRFGANRQITQLSWGDLSNFTCEEHHREERVVEFTTDEYGFRNASFSPDRATEIVILGDSFAFGSGTTQSKTFGPLLASRLGKNTYNLAVPGSPRDQIRNLLIEMPRLNVSNATIIIWMLFEGNDLDDSSPVEEPIIAARRPISEQLLAQLLNFQSGSPTRKLLKALGRDCFTRESVVEREIDNIGTVLFYKPYDGPVTRTVGDVDSSIGWKNIQLSMKTMQRIAKEKGFRVLVVLAPTKAQVYTNNSTAPSALSYLLEKETANIGFEFLDLKPALMVASKALIDEHSRLLWWRDDTHWNTAGHETVANLLETFLLREHTVPEVSIKTRGEEDYQKDSKYHP